MKAHCVLEVRSPQLYQVPCTAGREADHVKFLTTEAAISSHDIVDSLDSSMPSKILIPPLLIPFQLEGSFYPTPHLRRPVSPRDLAPNHNPQRTKDMPPLVPSRQQENDATRVNSGSGRGKMRKPKGQGNWTRTTLACVSCRRMKIRVRSLRIHR